MAPIGPAIHFTKTYLLAIGEALDLVHTSPRTNCLIVPYNQSPLPPTFRVRVLALKSLSYDSIKFIGKSKEP